AATGLTGQPVDTLAGTFGIDKSEPLVGDTITATLAPTTPAAIDATTLVKYQWYTGTSATAIDTKITSATAAAYTVVTGDQGKYLKVEVRVIGFHGIKAAATNAVTEGSGPQITEKDSAAFAVTAGDTALKITGTTTTASFKDGSGIKVYIKDNGKEALITDATPAPTGYTAPSGTAVLIAEHDATSGKPVLWVKGLTAAATPVASGKLISGTADITVKIAVGAQDGDVGAVAAPVSGVATVIPAGTYAINGTAGSAGQITLVSGYQITYFSSASGASQVQNAPVPAANDFNKQIIDVLTTATSGLVADDKITVDAKGIITGAEIVAASPTTAKINAVLALLDTTLGVDGAPDDDVTVPAGVTLTIAASKKLTIPASKTLTVSGTLAVAGILAWTNNTAVLIIQAGGEVTGTAAAAFHAKAATTTGADLALTVTAASDPTTATGWTSSNATAPASVVLTTTSPAGAPGTGSAYVLGNASFAINNCTTGAAVTAVTSTVGTPAAGGIKAGTGTAVVIIGSA
ncbi:MAG: hypothetical protein LBD24_00355, partial [Spirochaetaceae bacterium]|nr:hypothetical protein [Spirochaetaceae bacterium]